MTAASTSKRSRGMLSTGQDHEGLSAGVSPVKYLNASMNRAMDPNDSWMTHPSSVELRTAQTIEGVIKAGFLEKRRQKASPHGEWQRRYFFLLPDRLCYAREPDPPPGSRLKYLPLDKFPIRPLPRQYKPQPAVTLLERRLVPGAWELHPTKAAFSLTCGVHTYFLMAESDAEAQAWVQAIGEAWIKCVKHSLRHTEGRGEGWMSMVVPQDDGAAERFREQLEDEQRRRAEAERAAEEARRDAEAAARRAAEAEQRQREQQRAPAAPAEPQVVEVVREVIKEVPAAPPETFPYRVSIRTGRHEDAGFSGPAELALVGDAGASEWHRVDGPFQRGCAASEKLVEPRHLGKLRELALERGRGAGGGGWQLERVTVWDVKHNEKFVFEGPFWLRPPRDGEERAQLRINPGARGAAADRPATTYELAVQTGDEQGAGTDADVHAELEGDAGKTGWFRLPARPHQLQRSGRDVFTVPDVPSAGDLTHLNLEVGGIGRDLTWRPKQVDVTDKATGRTYTFRPDRWLDGGDADEARGRFPLADGAGAEDPLSDYVFTVCTGGAQGAGTQADVCVVMRDVDGHEAEPAVLDERGKEFKRGSEHAFARRCRRLGELREIDVSLRALPGQDGPTWFLERILIEHKALGRTYLFPCGDWIDRSCGMMRRLPAKDPGAAGAGRGRYDITVTTGDVHGAGTDGDVRVEFAAADGVAGPFLLDDPGASFDRGTSRAFEREGAAVGDLTHCTVELLLPAGSSKPWYLDKVEVRHHARDRTYVFPCNGWIGPNNDFRMRLSAGDGDGPRGAALAEYVVAVDTADVRGAETDASVFLVLAGADGSTRPMELAHATPHARAPFRRGEQDVFRVRGEAVGRMASATLSVDGRGANPNWCVDRMHVRENVDDQEVDAAWFLFENQWLGPAHPLRERTVDARRAPPPEPTTYRLRVVTADERFAGTDADISADIQGEHGSSGFRPLVNDSGKDLFERGSVDDFVIGDVRDLGELHTLVLQSNGRGVAADWLFERAEVTHVPSGRTWHFPGPRWIGRKGALEARIAAGEAPRAVAMVERDVVLHTSADRGSGTTSALWVAVEGADGAQSARVRLEERPTAFKTGDRDEFRIWTEDVGPVQALWVGLVEGTGNMEWLCAYGELRSAGEGDFTQFPCGQWLSRTRGDRQTARRLVPGRVNAGKTHYTLDVHTSALPGAGTSGLVFAELAGDRGRSGEQELLPTSDAKPFQPGSADRVFMLGDDVGDMQELTVRLQGVPADPRPEWHLSHVRAEHGTSGQERWFVFQRWLSDRTGLVATARPSAGPPAEPKVPELPEYDAWVFTAPGHNSGMDGQAALTLVGAAGARGGPHPLIPDPGAPQPFGAGQADHFRFKQERLGELDAVELHATFGRIPSWCVSKVVVRDPDGTETTFVPEAGGPVWLTKDVPGRTLRRFANKVYEMETTTGERTRAGPTQLTVSVAGTHGTIPEHIVVDHTMDPLPHFRAGQPFECELDAPEEPGDLRDLTLKVGGRGTEWHLNTITLKDRLTGQKWYFPYNDVIFIPLDAPEDTKTVAIRAQAKPLPPLPRRETPPPPQRRETPPPPPEPEIAPAPAPPGMDESTGPQVCDYKIDVVTGMDPDVRQDVAQLCKVRVFGEEKSSEWIELSQRTCTNPKVHGLLFMPDARDEFAARDRDLGQMVALELEMDNGRRGVRWLLREMVVTNATTGAVARFPCEAVLRADKGAPLSHRLGVEPGVIDEAPSPRASSSGGGSHDEGFLRGRRGPPGYRVTFYTSKKAFAGTSAQVHFELLGDAGSSGLVFPPARKKSFKRGKVDTFEYPAMEYLGKIRQLRLGHNGKGPRPGWHVALVEVVHIPTGRKFRFQPASAWIKKATNNQLFVSAVDPKTGRAPVGPQILQTQTIAAMPSSHGGTQHGGAASRPGTPPRGSAPGGLR
ncbi:unnamed protein product [Pedinophyceae sp. YPF-701]|nr:unnamed protein product [Pedinophyceae sp. YPF-701]